MRLRLISILVLLTATVVWGGTSIWELRNTPTTEVFNGIYAPNNDFAFAVGENGAIVHIANGDNGTLVPSGTTNELFDVYATSTSMALAVGEEIALMWDGSTWETIETGAAGSIYTGTWISPEEDILWYGILDSSPFGTVCPFEPGAAMQPFCRAFINTAMLTACGVSEDAKLFMTSGDIWNLDKFLVEANGTLAPVHDQVGGLGLTGIYVPQGACIPGPIAPLEIFAIRGGNEFWRFDGNSWANMNVAVPAGQTLTWLNGTGRGNIVATGFESNGMGGNQGVIWIYDGTSWTQDTDLPPGTPGLTDVAANLSFNNDLFENGFETTTRSQIRMANGRRVDFLATAEDGNFLITADLFPDTASDVSIEKTLLTPPPYRNGDRIEYQFVIFNSGPETAEDFRVVDGHLDSIQHVSDTCGSGPYNMQAGWVYRDFRIASLPPNTTFICTLMFDVVGNVGDEIRNYGAVAETNEVNYDNNQSDIRGIMISP